MKIEGRMSTDPIITIGHFAVLWEVGGKPLLEETLKHVKVGIITLTSCIESTGILYQKEFILDLMELVIKERDNTMMPTRLKELANIWLNAIEDPYDLEAQHDNREEKADNKPVTWDDFEV